MQTKQYSKTIKEQVYPEGEITTAQALDKEVMRVSKANPKKYVTYSIRLGKVRIFIHDRKPSSPNSPGAEDSCRYDSGFYKNGEIIKPSNSFMARYNYCPISN